MQISCCSDLWVIKELNPNYNEQLFLAFVGNDWCQREIKIVNVLMRIKQSLFVDFGFKSILVFSSGFLLVLNGGTL